MILWRLSGSAHVRSFDGGYGLSLNGRWNTIGHAVTYCATSPSLCVLEKLVHVEDPDLLPALVMVSYEVPDDLALEAIGLGDMPPDWRHEEGWSQQRGDAWHDGMASPLLRVPSAIMPVAETPDMNVIVNHRHPGVARISMVAMEPFALDIRLF